VRLQGVPSAAQRSGLAVLLALLGLLEACEAGPEPVGLDDEALAVGRKVGITKDAIVQNVASYVGEPVPVTAAAPAAPQAGEPLAEGGAPTPAPDPGGALAPPPRFAPPIPRAEGRGPVSEQEAAALVDQRCRSCHRFEGEPESKFRIAAPDLMWGGQKYRREWLVGWLQGQEPSMYPGAYRWDLGDEPPLHPTLVPEEAEAVADYFERHLRDPRVREGAFDPSTLTELEARIGADLYREYSCIGCHQVLEKGEAVGGPISTTFFDAGHRYDPDWVWSFNLDPPSFTPHSGEYVADLSERKVRWLTGYLMTLGVEDFAYARPWETAPFRDADAERGAEVYRAYCAQCHGLSGEGDGPGAAGLEPKPAAHARMAIHQLPDDYLYNVVFYGGKQMGKSAQMPDWGLTLSTQQIADVIAYMRASFRAEEAAAAGGVCPQPRATPQAPPDSLALENPLAPTPENLEAGRALYLESAVPMPCKMCHGESGDGLGPLAAGFTPRPRNFQCAETLQAIPDGQLFWIIRTGSPGTGMLAYSTLSDEQVWQLVLFVRQLAQ
jgi:mono/diheme cytochrome c family protein